MHVGIDLGTTFCCMAYVDDDGRVRVIPNADGERTTPSVIWFDGRQAWVGKKANQQKPTAGQHIYEFVKRDIGRPVELPPDWRPDDPAPPQVAPYEVDRFKYGAAGMSAIILRKLKKEAVLYFKKAGTLDRATEEKSFDLAAVITVPAYFGEKEREETKLAGYAAGFDVVGIVNEPTAAALAYGFLRPADQRIMVFDLGGGTLDVTILRMRDGEPHVVSSVGNNTLGGRDWDALIEQYLYEAFRRANDRSIPDDPQRLYEVQDLALRAKFALTEQASTEVVYSIDEGDLACTLYRDAPADRGEYDIPAADDAFYFDERATDLLSRCQAICEAALVERLPDGSHRPLAWADVDEIVLAGGACRMPMIPAMLERISGRRIRRHVEGFDYDTAIATGAALYGLHRARVTDVVSHGLGVRLVQEGRSFVDYLIEKDTPLPAAARRAYRAGASARLEVYEGESRDPDDCSPRGELRLGNSDGHVAIDFALDTDGILRAAATYPVDAAGHAPADGPSPVREQLEIRNDLYRYDRRARPLRDKVQSLTINL